MEEAISLAEERASSASVDVVKEILITELGVKATVRPEVLDKQIAVQIEERARKRDDDAIERLPEAARIAISEMGAHAERLMGVTLARQFMTCEAAEANRAEEDARHRREFIRRVAELEAERVVANGRAEAAKTKLAAKDVVMTAKDRQIARLEKKVIRLAGIVEGRERALKAIQPRPGEPRADHAG